MAKKHKLLEVLDDSTHIGTAVKDIDRTAIVYIFKEGCGHCAEVDAYMDTDAFKEMKHNKDLPIKKFSRNNPSFEEWLQTAGPDGTPIAFEGTPAFYAVNEKGEVVGSSFGAFTGERPATLADLEPYMSKEQLASYKADAQTLSEEAFWAKYGDARDKTWDAYYAASAEGYKALQEEMKTAIAGDQAQQDMRKAQEDAKKVDLGSCQVTDGKEVSAGALLGELGKPAGGKLCPTDEVQKQ